MEETVKDRILAYMKAKSLSQNRFEEAIGMSHGYINNLKSSPTARVLQKIFSTFPNLNQSWLLTGEGQMLNDAPTDNRESAPSSAVPVYDIDATCGLSDTRTFADITVEGYVDIPPVSKGTVIIRAHGDSMNPTIQDNDYIAIRRLETWDYIMFGHIYIIELPDYRAVKRIRRGSDDGHVILRSDNDNYDDVEIPKADIRSLWIVENVISIKKLF